MRQGNDRGTQYRSGIYTYSPAQETEAQTSKTMYQNELNAAQHGMITTEILPAEPFYYAEDYHQQYLAKNPAPPQNGLEQAMFGMGCFLGVERIFWQTQGVHVTAVGYSGGQTPNPTYQEVCTGQTAHNEVVWLTYDPKIIPYSALLQVFWQGHNPTQGMRQGNDRGTQYRSGIYTYSPAQETEAQTSKTMYQNELNAAQHGMITTEILPAEPFYYAEDYHQQYLAKNPAPPQNGLEQAMFGMGCFWGVERIFWQTQGVHVTAVGYSGGQTPNPTYQEVCTGQTAHNEVVWLTYDPKNHPLFCPVAGILAGA